MRGFYQVFARAILQPGFAYSIIEKASDVNNPFSGIKAFCRKNGIRVSAIEQIEIRRVFKKGLQSQQDRDYPDQYYTFNNKLSAFRNEYLKNSTPINIQEILKDKNFCEYFSIMFFDDEFYEKIYDVVDAEKIKDVLLNCDFDPTEINDASLNIFAQLNAENGEKSKIHRNEIHRLRWIRPYFRLVVTKNVCWGNISKQSLKSLEISGQKTLGEVFDFEAPETNLGSLLKEIKKFVDE